MQWYIKCLKNYVAFSGRARRKEYWMFVLFNIIFAAVVGTLDSLLKTNFIISSLYSLVILLPSLAVLVRRLHDIGKSGGWIFIVFIPLVGGIWLLVLLCKEGNPGPNQYGDNPKQAPAPAA